MQHSLSYNPNKDFDSFLAALHRKDEKAWNWLVAKFRKKLVPYLHKRITSYPRSALLSKNQFIEEVIEEVLLQFFQLFQTGSFANYGNLEAAVVTVASYKLKEGFARLKREQRLAFVDTTELDRLKETASNEDLSANSDQIMLVQEKLNQLPNKDKDLLVRYFDGEELQDIASDLKISAAACRKRKQRIIEKLKALVFKTINLLFLICSI